MTQAISFILILFLFSPSFFLNPTIAQSTSLFVNDLEFFDIYVPNVYIVDLRKQINNRENEFFLTCKSGQNALDLNLTFTGLNSKNKRVEKNLINVPGTKEVQMNLKTPLQSTFTGQYNCTALYENGLVESVSWYIYFYPGDGKLFLDCPLFGSLRSCLVFYRLKVPFKIPCKTLHPDVKVFDQSNNPSKFDYNSQIGFYGQFTSETKTFECKASYEGFNDQQRYELSRKSFSTKISISPPENIDLVKTGDAYSLLVKKGQPLNLTCTASVGCNDMNYDIKFITNITGKYRVVLNQPDRTKCLINYNEMAEFSKSILIDSLSHNASQVKCEIKFGTELKTESPNYLVFFADKSYLRHDPKTSVAIDYNSITDGASFLVINTYFEASESFNIDWNLNKKSLNIKEGAQSLTFKYTSICTHISIFSHHCYLLIDDYSNKDIGEYTAVITLKENPDVNISLNALVIKPKSPDISLIQPRFCSQNWTCEIGKKTTLQCNAQAHHVKQMQIKTIECKSLEECYKLKKNLTIFEEIIIELNAELLIKQEVKGGTERIVSTQKNKYKASELQSNDYEDDHDHEGTHHRYEPRPTNFDKIETLDNSVTWAFKSKFQTKEFHLVICVARNEIGDSVTSRIIIPSDLENGKPYRVKVIKESAKDNDDFYEEEEIVEGDAFSLNYSFNNVLFKSNDYELIKRTNENDCPIKLSTDPISKLRFTQNVLLQFSDVTDKCNSNYTLRLKVNDNKYFSEPPNVVPINPRIEFMLNVLQLIKPYFIHQDGKNMTLNMGNNQTYANNTVTITTNDIKVKSDETIMLNCESYGRPKPKVIWFKDFKLLKEDKHKFINGSLQIYRTHHTDSGFYQCDVNNRYGSLSRSFNVEVEFVKVEKSLSKTQKAIIWISSIASVLLFVLLILAIAYGCAQKVEKDKVKKKHKNFIRFLNGEEDLDDGDLEKELLINTKLDNIKKIKFDDKKWEIDPTRFLIHENKVLGEGNFGKVCLASVSNEKIRDESEIGKEINILDPASGTALSRKFSMRRQQNAYMASKTSKDFEISETSQPLLPKGARLVAVKMVKDNKLSSSNMDSLLQELKIMGYIGFHINVIQLIGCYTSQLGSDGLAYVFVEYCSNGDLKTWLKKNKSRYSQVEDSRTSMFSELKKRLSTNRSLYNRQENSLKDSNISSLAFNDSDLLFFGYQICQGMDYLARKKFLHRDLAARNILLGQYFECKISDFGLADESKLESQSYFGRPTGHMPLKWTPPEALIGLKYEGNSDVWSFGIVLWEIFTLCQDDPYPSILNKDFREYMRKISSGEESPPLPENGSNEIHEIMNECWIVDHRIRPTFEKLTPKIKELLNDSHKQYYDSLNQAFKKQCEEIKRERNERSEINSQIQRESQANPKSVPNIQVPAFEQQPDPKKGLKPIAPKAPVGYLEPQSLTNKNNLQQSGTYLEPSKPGQSGYLEPIDKSSDTYTGPSSIQKNLSKEKDTYIVPSTHSNYLNDNNVEDFMDNGYVNDDVINELDSKRFDNTSKYPNQNFKRVGSNTSTSTVNSTASSTAPLLNQKYEPKFTRIKTNPNASPDNYKNFLKESQNEINFSKLENDKNENEINFSKLDSGKTSENLKRFVYTPPQPVHLNKLTQFKPNKNNETDV